MKKLFILTTLTILFVIYIPVTHTESRQRIVVAEPLQTRPSRQSTVYIPSDVTPLPGTVQRQVAKPGWTVQKPIERPEEKPVQRRKIGERTKPEQTPHEHDWKLYGGVEEKTETTWGKR